MRRCELTDEQWDKITLKYQIKPADLIKIYAQQ